jgi:signal recognition particle subunit SRP54
MFENLTGRLQAVLRDLGRRGKLRPEDLDSALRQIRLALLEADVDYDVVRRMLEAVAERAVGADVPVGADPARYVAGIMHAALVETLGEPAELQGPGSAPQAVVLVGLQGSGKTTTAGKLAGWLAGHGRRVLLVAADRQRPAARQQLQILGQRIPVPVHLADEEPVAVMVERAMTAARQADSQYVIFDTAGRSQLDEPLMTELAAIGQHAQPVETLLVVDAMTGQQAVHVAQGFDESIPLSGLILTKVDGDSRGGAAISIRSVTGIPIKFLGTGEALDDLEQFDPDRLASRILGMGDMVGLMETAQEAVDPNEAGRTLKRLQTGSFDLEDFINQLDQVQRLGPLGKVLNMLPAGVLPAGLGTINHGQLEHRLQRTRAILNSMTRQERRRPDLFNASRKRRVAAGSGTSVQEVNQLLRQHKQMAKLMKRMGNAGLTGSVPGFP